MQSIRLFSKDILIKPVKAETHMSSVIHVVYKEDHQEGLNRHEVLQIADDVTEVKVGDVILLDYMDHTPVMEWNNIRCAITNEKNIVGVFEE